MITISGGSSGTIAARFNFTGQFNLNEQLQSKFDKKGTVLPFAGADGVSQPLVCMSNVGKLLRQFVDDSCASRLFWNFWRRFEDAVR